MIGVLVLALVGIVLSSAARLAAPPAASGPPSEAGDRCLSWLECRSPFPMCAQNTGEAGFCTRTCSEDDDCPDAMRCTGLFFDRGGTMRVCER